MEVGCAWRMGVGLKGLLVRDETAGYEAELRDVCEGRSGLMAARFFELYHSVTGVETRFLDFDDWPRSAPRVQLPYAFRTEDIQPGVWAEHRGRGRIELPGDAFFPRFVTAHGRSAQWAILPHSTESPGLQVLAYLFLSAAKGNSGAGMYSSAAELFSQKRSLEQVSLCDGTVLHFTHDSISLHIPAPPTAKVGLQTPTAAKADFPHFRIRQGLTSRVWVITRNELLACFLPNGFRVEDRAAKVLVSFNAANPRFFHVTHKSTGKVEVIERDSPLLSSASLAAFARECLRAFEWNQSRHAPSPRQQPPVKAGSQNQLLLQSDVCELRCLTPSVLLGRFSDGVLVWVDLGDQTFRWVSATGESEAAPLTHPGRHIGHLNEMWRLHRESKQGPTTSE